MSKKANLILLIIAGLFLVSLGMRNGSFALMTMPFLSYLIVGLLTSPGEIKLQVSRSLSTPRCESGDSITNTLIIQNDGPDIACLKIDEPILPKIQVINGNFGQRVALRSREKVELSFSFKAPRGRYEWRSIRFIVSDPFGLFERQVEIPVQAKTLVLPQPLPLRRLPVRLSHTLRTTGPNLSRMPGSGIDFWGVREYHPGDSLRWIHWRNSARHPQQVFTKEFEREEMANIGLMLDARAINDGVHTDEELLEYSIQATASLAKSLLQQGNRVSLLVLGKSIMRVFPGTGKHQLVRILDRLAECESGENISFDSLKYLPVRLFPANSMIIVISPLRPGDFPSIARLRAEGYQVMLVSPDPVEFATQLPPESTSASLAIRAARLERSALLWKIRQIGIQTVNWQVHESLARQNWKPPRSQIGAFNE